MVEILIFLILRKQSIQIISRLHDKWIIIIFNYNVSYKNSFQKTFININPVKKDNY